MTRRLDWEKSAKQEIVRRRGADPVERPEPSRAIWMTDADRLALAELGWRSWSGGGLMQPDAHELKRRLRRLAVTMDDVEKLKQIKDVGRRRAEARRLQAKLKEGESAAVAGATKPIPTEVRRAILNLSASIESVERRGAAPQSSDGKRPKLSEMSNRERATLARRLRSRRQRPR